MSMAVPLSAAFVPVCSQARDRLAAFPVLRAGREEKAEGKIKETGTLSGRFLGKPLSAHCFWDAGHGTMLLGFACRDLAQSLGFAGF